MTISQAHKRYEFKRQLEEMRRKTGKGTELISLYIPYDKLISDVTAQLRAEHGQAANIKSKSTRTNVQSALESVLARLSYYNKPPERGFVIFCGKLELGGHRTTLDTIIIEPPEPITSYKYHCDSSFYLEPLEYMLVEQKTFGLLAVDRREATVGLLRGKVIEARKRMTSTVPGKQRQGGQSAKRFQQLRLIAIHDFYKKIGNGASEIFLSVDHKDFEGVLIGGPSPTKEEFFEGEFLHHELQKKIIGLFDVAYTDESGLHELVDAASDALQDLDVIKQKKIMQRFMQELVSDGGLVAYGDQQVRENLAMGAVGTLLISEDLRQVRADIRCQNCDYTRKDTREYGSYDFEEKCPLCSSDLKIVDTVDVVDELTELCDQMGTGVEFISTDFEEGDQLMRAFGGIAAILRYNAGV
ncbi:MAG: peptide chain release factor 1 [Methanosarcinales archaeon]|nr:MAG: peptide chain release factor 1 [Methanosarcinales archaeon]